MSGEARKIVGRLSATPVRYSSVVGQTVTLSDETGAVVAQLSIRVPNPDFPYQETAAELAQAVTAAFDAAKDAEVERLRASNEKMAVALAEIERQDRAYTGPRQSDLDIGPFARIARTALAEHRAATGGERG